MQILQNTESIEQLAQTIPSLQDELKTILGIVEGYLYFMKDEKYQKNENESLENQYKRGENMLDRILQIEQQRKQMALKNKETLILIDNIKKTIEEINKSCENDEDNVVEAKNEVIDEMLFIQEKIMEEKNAPLLKDIEKNKKAFEECKVKLLGEKGETKEERRVRLEKEERERREAEERENKRLIQLMNLEQKENQQLETWTNKKCGEVLFDSDKDNWSKGSDVLGKRMKNKNHFIFIIEDTTGNKFGGYITATISYTNYWFDDSNAFLFSLKSNGRINGMKKFNVSDSSSIIDIDTKSGDWLFLIGLSGYDIEVKRKDISGSYCSQYQFNYEGITNALCGQRDFTPKRIVFIQMN